MDVCDLLTGAGSAIVLVDGSGDLPERLLLAGREASQQVLINLRPGAVIEPILRQNVAASSASRPLTEVRVSAVLWGDRRPDLVVLSRSDGDRGPQLTLAVASGRLTGDAPEGCVVALEVDGEVAWEFEQWFMAQWVTAVPVSEDMPEPPSWPVLGASPTALAWQAFVDRLSVVSALTADAASAVSGPEDKWDEEEDLGDTSSAAAAEASSVVAVVRPPSIERAIKAVYGRGWLVSINVSRKVPTYRLDVAGVLGLPPRSSRGRASASSSVHLDLLPVSSRARIDRLRGEATRILNRHAFTLDENQKWMTRAAYEHFQERLQAMPQIANVAELLGEEIPDYVDREMDSWVESLSQVLEVRRIGTSIGAPEAERLRCAANEYLSRRAVVAVRASSTPEGLAFQGGSPECYERPQRLLLAVAKTTRARLAAPASSAKRNTEGPPLPSLDVVGGDGLLHQEPSHDVRRAAHHQLRELQQIESAGLDPMMVCEALLHLLQRTMSDSVRGGN